MLMCIFNPEPLLHILLSGLALQRLCHCALSLCMPYSWFIYNFLSSKPNGFSNHFGACMHLLMRVHIIKVFRMVKKLQRRKRTNFYPHDKNHYNVRCVLFGSVYIQAQASCCSGFLHTQVCLHVSELLLGDSPHLGIMCYVGT